ncbi:PREDICTED: uncharacterized protein LOC104819099 isoform X2 [Tarenaya hassleriana]|uniref:uncharacterized protein LOC104819099 isoform X2 n=1 Tax=Tarenaya hassleriana TaxID=28532 RepID=UPI0008FD6846|nr:PREDICTED: uncharacterized protein LOC104819099 isoform X2 [Tarenaya hassleriana]
MEQVKLLTHNHPLHRSYQPSRLCSLCRREGWIYDGYRCSECRDFKSHKECAESPPQIESPSHPQHTLKLILMSRDTDNKYCDCCGVELLSGVAYHCSVCDFWVDTSCVRLPPPHDMGLHKAHGHPLAYVKIREIGFTCDVCDQHSNGYHYECKECDCYFHMECADLSQELTHSSHPFHPLKLLTEDEMYDLPNSMCPLCQCELSNRSCFLCKFSICNECAKNPPPLSILSLTTHDHTLTLLPISISFTCNACGMDGYWSPYVCLQCYFVIHIQCVDLPRIININRHDHRISRRYCLEPENPDPMCGKCRRPIDRRYGAYSCSTCPQYAVHSGCATSEDVWDGKELYWKPEEVEDVEPFKMIAHNVIEHFSHKQHHLKLTEDGNGCETSIHCKACIRSVNSGPFYSCMQCDSFLHEKCANLPLKKRHMVFGQQLDLVAMFARKRLTLAYGSTHAMTAASPCMSVVSLVETSRTSSQEALSNMTVTDLKWLPTMALIDHFVARAGNFASSPSF